MTRLAANQLNQIRQQPQQTKLFLSIFRPKTIFKAQVNGAITRGARIIPYDTVTIGAYTDIRADEVMVVYNGSDTTKEKGRVRVRSTSSIEFVVAENSDINWADNDVFVILKFWHVDARYPRITHDPANAEAVIFWKDYDIAYTNQNSVLGTFVNAGSHRFMFRDCSTGLAQTDWFSSGTFNLRTGTLSYDWEFEGGSPATSNSANPGTVTYTSPGHYVTRLSVSGSNGSVDTTYRYVSVYDYPGCGTGTPPLLWELSSLDGSRGEGGYTAQIVLHEVVNIAEGDVVIIGQENWYGADKVSFGSNPPNIIFSGYVLDDSVRINYKKSTVEFTAGSITSIMKQGEGFSCSVESKASPSTWFELLDMDVKRAIYHYLRWHTTVLNVTDVQFLGDDKKIQFFDADRGSLYDAIDSLIRSALIGSVVSDKQSKIWLEVDAYAQPNATGTFLPVMAIEKRDWMNEPRIEEQLANTTSFIEMGGIAYSGSTTGTFSALMTNAPGDAPSYRGKVERTQGLALIDQSQLNQLAGNVLANKNSRFPTIDMEMTGNFSNLDIAPQEVVQIDIVPEDNARGQRINSIYLPSSISWTWDAGNQTFVPRITFSIVTTGEPGETIPIPDVPPSEGFGNVPSLNSPTFPFSFPTPPNNTVHNYALFGAGPTYNPNPTTLTYGITIVSNSLSTSVNGGSMAFQVSQDGVYQISVDANWEQNGSLSGQFALIPTVEITAGGNGNHDDKLFVANSNVGYVTASFLGSGAADIVSIGATVGGIGSSPQVRLAANDQILITLGIRQQGAGTAPVKFENIHVSVTMISG